MIQARIILTAIALFAVTLTTCSGDPTIDLSRGNTDDAATIPTVSPSNVASSPDLLSTRSSTPSRNLDAIIASDADVPETTVPTPWVISSIQTKVLRDSSNAQVVGVSSTVTVNYVGVNGRTGVAFGSSFQRGGEATSSMGGVIVGFKNGLTGQKVSSGVLISMIGVNGYTQGNSQAGIQMGDFLVFVIDVTAASYDKATGETAIPVARLPTVTMIESKPEAMFPESGASTGQLMVQPLIKGPGEMTEADSTVSVKHRAWRTESGKMILDGWRGAQSGKFSALINGRKTGLLRQTVGSRMILVMSSADSFPNGEPSKGLEVGEGLVYVIDILGVKVAS